MSEWQELQIKDLIQQGIIEKPLDGNHGEIHPKGEDFVESGIPFVMASDINGGKVDLNACKFITEQQASSLRKGFAKAGDVLLTHKASLGRTALVPNLETEYIMLTPQVTYYRIKDESRLLNRYLKYYFDSPFFQDTLTNHGDAGSTRAYIGITAQHELPVILPPLPEQKAIASVLSSLDDKIDLLHRQNKTLEAMAETLFRQWFIEEAKEDWDVSPLGDVVKIAYGKNLPTSRLLDSGYPVFGGNGQIGFYDRFLYSEPQVLVSCRGEASGKVNISLPNSFITNNSLILERKENGISFEYLKFYALAYDFGLHVSGSAQPQITIDGLFNAEFRWPPLGLVESFTEVVRPLEDKRLTNYIQIQILENLRNTLLPKLMSGEVRVQYQTEEVA
jgi:type I restriction enzyme S subunit